ncbi:MAG TPA: DNA recombination protein RmuC [Ignavibacteriaceae bacterium]|nr:DNA recombination protein RmuC [Ignavibacteriaceae bacterium]
MQEIIFLVIGLVIGAFAAFFIAKLKFEGSADKAGERNSFLEEEISKTEKELNSEREKVLELNSDYSALNSDYRNLQEKLAEQNADIENRQKQLAKDFELLANRIFEEKTNKFSEQSKSNLAEILNPLKEKISEFQIKVEQTNKEGIDRFSSLREQLSNLKDLNQQMSQDAKNLVKALKGDTKVQGDWGEIQLERILERSGLRKGEEYSIQESITTDEGRKRPDVIVNLPEDKKIIIDSKVSLVSYERFMSAENDEERGVHLKSFIDSLKRHIKELSEKNYQNLFDQGSLDFVLMFIPIEPAFSLAIQFGEDLYAQAWDKRIMMVSPLNLFTALKTIANIWKQEYQNRNVIEIAKQSGALYDKFVGFVEDLQTIGNRIEQTQSSYHDAMKKLSKGSANLISRAEKIKKLGAKTTKSLPESLLDDEDENLLEK